MAIANRWRLISELSGPGGGETHQHLRLNTAAAERGASHGLLRTGMDALHPTAAECGVARSDTDSAVWVPRRGIRRLTVRDQSYRRAHRALAWFDPSPCLRRRRLSLPGC
jgi:hypothetical protein